MWLRLGPSKTATSFTLVYSSSSLWSSRNVWITPATRMPGTEEKCRSFKYGKHLKYYLPPYVSLQLLTSIGGCCNTCNISKRVDYLITWKANRWNIPVRTEVISKLWEKRHSAAWHLHVWRPWSHFRWSVALSVTSKGWK